MKIFPSLISADLLRLGDVIRAIDADVDGYHLDIMDDHFVPNLTWGPAFINALRAATARPFQVHLMVDNPLAWVTRLNLQTGDSFVFHVEAVVAEAVHELVGQVCERGWRVGLAINPGTPVEQITQYLQNLDEVLIMSVQPGFSGQLFIDTTARVRQVREFCLDAGIEVPLLCMDGGINIKNIGSVALAGVELVGVAKSVFDAGDAGKNIQNLRRLATSCLSGC